MDKEQETVTIGEKDRRIQELEGDLKVLKKTLWAHVEAMTAATNLITELMKKRIGAPLKDEEDDV